MKDKRVHHKRREEFTIGRKLSDVSGSTMEHPTHYLGLQARGGCASTKKPRNPRDCEALEMLARPGGVEPPTFRSVVSAASEPNSFSVRELRLLAHHSRRLLGGTSSVPVRLMFSFASAGFGSRSGSMLMARRARCMST